MGSMLYVKIPLFRKKKMEKKIINELRCPCYKVLDDSKYFADSDGKMLIVMGRSVVTATFIECSSDYIENAKQILYSSRF